MAMLNNQMVDLWDLLRIYFFWADVDGILIKAVSTFRLTLSSLSHWDTGKTGVPAPPAWWILPPAEMLRCHQRGARWGIAGTLSCIHSLAFPSDFFSPKPEKLQRVADLLMSFVELPQGSAGHIQRPLRSRYHEGKFINFYIAISYHIISIYIYNYLCYLYLYDIYLAVSVCYNWNQLGYPGIPKPWVSILKWSNVWLFRGYAHFTKPLYSNPKISRNVGNLELWRYHEDSEVNRNCCNILETLCYRLGVDRIFSGLTTTWKIGACPLPPILPHLISGCGSTHSNHFKPLCSASKPPTVLM
jgi:hypothetical protein